MARAELNMDDLIKFVADIFDGMVVLNNQPNYVNIRLTEFIVENPKYISNNWFLMDNPNLDSIRVIYQNNDPTNLTLQTNKAKVDELGRFCGIKYWISQAPIESIFDLFILFKF